MKYIRLIMINAITLVALFSTLAPATPVYAWSPFGGVQCTGNAAQSVVCGDRSKNKDPITGGNGIIMKVVNIVAIIGGIAGFIIIIVSGFRFVVSGGSGDEVAGARRGITYALIGLVVILLARTLVAFILGRL